MYLTQIWGCLLYSISVIEKIWQHDVLRFSPWTQGKFHKHTQYNKNNHNPNKPVGTQHVWGRCRFGDNIDDEWFIVMLMQELTTHFNGILVK